MKRDFSWSGAMFAGFGVLRREPSLLLVWTLVALVFAVADQVSGVSGELHRLAGRGSGYLVLKSLFRGAIIAVGMGVLSAAVYRAVLRPMGEARGRTRFGLDEIRLALLWSLQGLALIVIIVMATIPMALLSPKSYGHNNTGYMVVLAGVMVLVLVVWSWMLARLSLAGPMTVATGRWSAPAGWSLTRGRTWRILGLHLAVALGLAVAFSIWNALYGVVATAVVPGFSVGMLRADAAYGDLFRPVRLIFTILNAGLSAVAAALLYAPAAAIYRDLTDTTPDDQAAVFD